MQLHNLCLSCQEYHDAERLSPPGIEKYSCKLIFSTLLASGPPKYDFDFQEPHTEQLSPNFRNFVYRKDSLSRQSIIHNHISVIWGVSETLADALRDSDIVSIDCSCVEYLFCYKVGPFAHEDPPNKSDILLIKSIRGSVSNSGLRVSRHESPSLTLHLNTRPGFHYKAI